MLQNGRWPMRTLGGAILSVKAENLTVIGARSFLSMAKGEGANELDSTNFLRTYHSPSLSRTDSDA
eukprot:825174-Prorocentrum_lima.AAC.1